MAKKITDEILRLNIFINGDDGQKKIIELERANGILNNRLKDLNETQKKLLKSRKDNAIEIEKNKKEIDVLTKAITDNKKSIDDEIKSMDIMKLTVSQLNQRIKDLRFNMNNMDPNSSAFKKAEAEMKALVTRQTELRKGSQATGTTINNLADKFNQYSGIATALTATLAGVVLSVQGVIDYNNKLVDAQTKVSKATGMSNEEVKELTKSFGELHTRTSTMDLLKIAEVGGKLGVPKAEISDFVKEVDKAYVALGDNFAGGVEAVANKLGKLKGLFKETRDIGTAESITKIGSAINELDNQGTASADNISDFALRVGQLPEKLKPAIAETLGLGAALEENGIDAERGASGYNKFVRVASTETKKFAEVMRISEAEVKKLINQDPLQFFLKFAEGAKGLDATEISKMLDFLKLNDAEVISVIGAASENTDRFRNSIELSNQALADGTSLQNEFNKVNTNSAAIYEKVKKSLIGAFSSETVAKGLNWMISSVGRLLGVVEETDNKSSLFRRTLSDLFAIIVIGITAFFSVNTAIAVYNNLIKESIVKNIALETIKKSINLINTAGTVIQNAYNLAVGYGALAYAKLTGSTTAQTIAQERLNLVTKANPFGALLSIIIALGTAYLLFRKESEIVANIQKQVNDALKEGAKNAGAEVNAIEQTYKKLTNKNLAEKERQAILDETNKKYPGYFANLTTEDFLLGKAANQYNNLRNAIIAASQARAADAKINEIAGKYLEKEVELTQIITTTQQKLKGKYVDETRNYAGSGGGGIYTITGAEKKAGDQSILANAQNELKKLQQQKIAEMNPLIDISNKNPFNKNNSNTTSPNSAYKTNFADEEKKPKHKKTAAEKEAEKAENKFKQLKERMLNEIEKANQLEIDLEIEKEETLANLKKDWYQRELAEILAAEDKKIAELDKKRISSDEFKTLDGIIAKTKGAEQAKFIALKQQWLDNNKELDHLKKLAAETTAFKIAALNQKAQQEAFKKQEEDLAKTIENNKNLINKALAENTTVEQQKQFLASLGYSDESLRKIKTWEEGRKEIEKYYQQKSLEDQVAFLREKIAQFNVLMATMPSSFSPEQLDQIEKYKLKITELLAEIQKLKNGDTGKTQDFSSLKQFGGGGNTDLLGLSTEQWKAMFTNTDNLAVNMQKVAAAVQVAQNMYSQFYAFQQANMQSELRRYEVNSDRKKKRLKTELDTGLINQETYKKLVLKADAELDRKKAEIEYKQAKRQRDMQIAQTIANTAMAIMGIWADFPKADFGVTAAIMSGVVGALGALQVATIMRQELPEMPGAEDGFYPVMRSQDRKMFNARKRQSSTGFYNEPTMLVGEQGKNFPELVVAGQDLKRINPKIQTMYEAEIARVRGFENGLYPQSSSASDTDTMYRMQETLDAAVKLLNKLDSEGVIARFENTNRTAKDIDDKIKERNLYIKKSTK